MPPREGGVASSTGLDPTTIASLIQSGCLDGLVDPQGHAVGLFDATLPTADALHALGLSVSGRYLPEALRSHQDDTDDDSKDLPDSAAGSSWTVSW